MYPITYVDININTQHIREKEREDTLSPTQKKEIIFAKTKIRILNVNEYCCKFVIIKVIHTVLCSAIILDEFT